MSKLATLVLGLLATGLVGSGLAVAHSEPYVNPNPSVGVSISETDCDTDPLQPIITSITNIGGYCYLAGHVTPNEDDEATSTVLDENFVPSTAVYCQDLDDDFICGERCLTCADTTLREEPRVIFCQTATLRVASAADIFPKPSADWAAGPNWVTDKGVIFFTMGVGQANATTGGGSCPDLVSPGTKGVGVHS